MTRKQITTSGGTTITVEMVRMVQDKVNYSDGYNIVVGREIIEFTKITLRDAAGKCHASGSRVDMVTPTGYRNCAELITKGAVARIGDSYVSQEIVDLVTAALAELETENPKSDEQIAIETAKIQSEAAYDAWYNSPEQIAYREFEDEMDSPNSDY
jgi:hypothetical protein